MKTRRTQLGLAFQMLIIIGGFILLFFIVLFFIRSSLASTNATDAYRECQSIYQTCEKINADLYTVDGLSDCDPIFSVVSKGRRLALLKVQLNRWVQQYNTKSKKRDRLLWKNDSLPLQLDMYQFSYFKEIQ